ncbi:hypothetical protein IGB42_01607 [Andreprevotia sp. IGB-42]|uniref:hypothetical protein n=1 Tax=Andreprevotia sp. IGB-42 TaxID=2497473 RepID=UPI00135B4DEB|nr:hypothetical protein [Andreprevotia sp. IGB-42]KAF0813928.1 hypothetical protein IGB42_01607 [Andreprevotia sp. IGB-42]
MINPQMFQSLNNIIEEIFARLNSNIETHHTEPQVSLVDHMRAKRKAKALHASTKKLIYLDTNAWKCMADYRQKKPSLTSAMLSFGNLLQQAVNSTNFVFPIGLPTFFELDSMTRPETRAVLTTLVDELSQGFCIAPFQERVGGELKKLRTDTLDIPDTLEDFLCSPIELLGIPTLSFNEHTKIDFDEEAFNKAFFDSLTELPFSFQLELASTLEGNKWDNSRGITELNAGKREHQAAVSKLIQGIFLELCGCIAHWYEAEKIELSRKDLLRYCARALGHWHSTPTSRALPTLRILSSLYGLMRLDSHRKYHAGDPNDFMVAASALPVAQALFTDKKLANLLADSNLRLDTFSDCQIISGFDEMAEYLGTNL